MPVSYFTMIRAKKVTFDEEKVRKYINENDNYLAIAGPVYSWNTDEGILGREVITQYTGDNFPEYLSIKYNLSNLSIISITKWNILNKV